ncbi:MAG: acyl-ACP--UDP-N-acetylglucosamine O-acyltransferase [Acidiferrobacteraceae bacterium]
MIHPLALVDPSARIAEDVHVGAFTVIGAEVEIGRGTWIGPHVVINGPTRIGVDNRIYQFCSIGEIAQDLKYRGEHAALEIGDRNIIREYCSVSRGTAGGGSLTRIGSDNLLMAYVHIAHDCHVGKHTIFANCASLAGHVLVEDHAVLGGFTGVHQFCRIGAHAMTAIGTVTFKDVPPFLMAAGNTARPHGINLTGLKRRGFSMEALAALRRAYRITYRSGLRLEEALAQLSEMKDSDEVKRFADFIVRSERGIIR